MTRRAFTILDMLMVLLILGVIIGVIVSNAIKARRAAQDVSNYSLLRQPIDKALLRGALTPKQYNEAREHLEMQMRVIRNRK